MNVFPAGGQGRAARVGGEVADYLGVLVARAQDVLGPRLLGAYAAGSLAMGAYQPGQSDIDVALVTTTSLSSDAKLALVDRLRHESHPCPARGLELVVYRVDVARSGTAEPGFELELNTGPRMRFRQTLSPADRPPADGLFWYGLDRAILHVTGLALLGPPADRVFGAVPTDDVHRLLAQAVRWWLDQPAPPDASTASAEAVLAASRALAWQRHRLWLPKVEAAQLLLTEGIGQRPVLTAAITAREGQPGPSAGQARTFQLWALSELQAP